MAQAATAAAASSPVASPALESASNYALEDGVALPPASSAPPHRRRRVLLIVAALVVVVGAAVAIGVAASSKSSSSKSSSSDPSNAISTGDAYVCDSVQQDFGYIALPNKRDGHYFYWYFESRTKPSEDPLVLWLTGGPGCSSLWAMLAENGPCHVQRDDLSTTKNPYSWNANANVIWLDQPTFTGYSYGAAPVDMDESAADVRANLYLFLQGFLDKHPALRARALFITGESYAGHYIPPSAQYIWEQNAAATSGRRINLQGIAIGNGITASTIQYEHYLDMAENAYGIPLASNAERLAGARANTSACVDRIRACQADPGPFECVDALNVCYEDMQSALDFTDRNPYDIRQECTEPNAVDCYNSTHITQFLNSPKIQSYLKIPTNKVPAWLECNDNVSSSFIYSGDYLADHQDAVAALLNGSDVRVLIYAGDADTVCNWRGNEAWTKQLAWTYQKEFNAAPERAFVTANGSKAGVTRSYGTQFTFLRVFESGHMVPMDQPAAALEMLQRFMANATL